MFVMNDDVSNQINEENDIYVLLSYSVICVMLNKNVLGSSSVLRFSHEWMPFNSIVSLVVILFGQYDNNESTAEMQNSLEMRE